MQPAQTAQIFVQGACAQHLKNVDLSIPFGSLTLLCGPSACGKSAILDAVLAAHWAKQRSALRALSSWKVQPFSRHRVEASRVTGLLDLMQVKPSNIDASADKLVWEALGMERLFPRVFGTALMWQCPSCQSILPAQQALLPFDAERSCAEIIKHYNLQVLVISAPFGISSKPSLHDLRRLGYQQALIDTQLSDLDAALKSAGADTALEIVFDQLLVRESEHDRVLHAMNRAFDLGAHSVCLTDQNGNRRLFTQEQACSSCRTQVAAAEQTTLKKLAPFYDTDLQRFSVAGRSLEAMRNETIRTWLDLPPSAGISLPECSSWTSLAQAISEFELSELKVSAKLRTLNASDVYALLCCAALCRAAKDQLITIDAPTRFLQAQSIAALDSAIQHATNSGAAVLVADQRRILKASQIVTLGQSANSTRDSRASDAALPKQDSPAVSLEALDLQALKPVALLIPRRGQDQAASTVRISAHIETIALSCGLTFLRMPAFCELSPSRSRVFDRLDLREPLAIFYSTLKPARLLGVSQKDFSLKRGNARASALSYRGRSFAAVQDLSLADLRATFSHLKGFEFVLGKAGALGIDYLPASRLIQALSMGERIKLELLLLLAQMHRKPCLLLLEFPFAGLCASEILRIYDVLSEFKEPHSRVIVLGNTGDFAPINAQTIYLT